jgi:NAD(P)-dependent dehydrogenase (short-subunit alcohol dehydrogenase family)
MINNQKTIIITGGLGLLGKTASEYFASKGYHVIVIDIHDEKKRVTSNISFIKFDLTDFDLYPILIENIKSLTSNLVCLINNASFNPKIEGNIKGFGKFEDLDLNTWNKEISLNLTAPVFLTKALLPIFNTDSSDYCKIINVISTYGIVPPNQSIYSTLSKKNGFEIIKPIGYPVTKAGLAMATKYLSVYLGNKGFNVNGIAPGGIENHQDKEFIDAYSQQVPMGRMAKVDEMLETLFLLATSGSNYINGQIISVDGGWTTW